MAPKTRPGKATPGKADGSDTPFPAQAAFPGVDLDLARGGSIGDFSAGRDDILSMGIPDSLMPHSEEEFYARDPFSADYAEFLKGKAEIRREKTPRVDAGLRADLLEKPYLMERPEDSTLRGAAAVWRSLRDQLQNESLAILDRSDPQELLMLQRELHTRKMVLASVSKGVDGLLSRLEQRLAEGPVAPSDRAPDPASDPAVLAPSPSPAQSPAQSLAPSPGQPATGTKD